jgi:hypothetical protein
MPISCIAEIRHTTLWQMTFAATSFRMLSTLKHVEVLSINGGRITDAGLQNLRRLPNLRMLNLVNTGVTTAGVEELRGALPPLRLIYRWDSRE